MTCVNHPLVEATGRCALCGRDVCGECGIEHGDRLVCRSCVDDLLVRAGSRPHAGLMANRLVAGLLSILPGLGHMYLGLIGKGFAIMGLLFASVFLVVLYSDSVGMYWMTAYLVPTISALLLSYAVFDAMAVADALRRGREREPDPTMDLIAERVLFNPRTAAFVILVAGVVGLLHLFESLLGTLMRSIGIEVPAAAIVVPVVLIVIGVRMLAKGRRAPRA